MPLPQIRKSGRRSDAYAVEQHGAHRTPELHDRRARHVRSNIQVRRGASRSHNANLTPWRHKHSGLAWNEAVMAARSVNVVARRTQDDARKPKTRIIGTERHSKKKTEAPPGRLTDDELFGWSRTKLKHVPPSKAELHRGQCYESALRPWRHACWTGVPSPPLPRQMWRKAPIGVLSTTVRPDGQSRAVTASSSKTLLPTRPGQPGVARMSLATTVAVGMSADGGESTVIDSGIKRFMTREQDVVRAGQTKFPRLGVSARLLEHFLTEHESQLRDRTCELESHEMIDDLFGFFNIEGELSAGRTAALHKTLENISTSTYGDPSVGSGKREGKDWFAAWCKRAKLVDETTQNVQPVSRELFSLIYTAPDCRGLDVLKEDHKFLLTTFAVTRTLIKPQTAKTRDSFARLHLNERDEGGAPLVGNATIFFSHAWRYNFVRLVKTIIAHLQTLEAKSKSNQPLFAWIDIMSMSQHDTLPASALQPIAGEQTKVAAESTNASLRWAMVFANAVGTMSELVLVLEPWDNPLILGRSWCLWEILAAVLHNVKLTITMPEQERSKFVKDFEERFGDIVCVFSNVCSEHADAQEGADRLMIHEAIRKTIGFAKLDEIVVTQLREWLLMEACSALRELPDDVRLQSPLGSAVPRLMHDMGKTSEAGRLLRERYELCVRCRGKEHPETIEAAGNLAVSLRQAAQKVSPLERDVQKKRCSQEAIANAETLSREVSGYWNSHQNTTLSADLIARSNLAVVLLHRFCMTVEHGHYDYKDIMQQMATFRRTAKENTALEAVPQPARMLIESERLLRSVLKNLEQRKAEYLRTRNRAQPGQSQTMKFGGSKGDFDAGRCEVEALSNLSQVLFAGGESQLGEAELLCSRALTIARKHFHDDDEVVLKLQCGLAHIKFTVSQLITIEASPKEMLVSHLKHREAIELYESVFEVRRRLFGMDNEDTKNVGSALARLRKMQKDPYSPYVTA